jgi:hypothetical protein
MFRIYIFSIYPCVGYAAAKLAKEAIKIEK